MKKRIYWSIFTLALLSIVLTSILITFVLYKDFYKSMQEEIRNEAYFISVAYNQAGEKYLKDIEKSASDSRITLIKRDGTVLYDNKANVAEMDNHSNRPEVQQAIDNGFGESTHVSNTLGDQTFYRAIVLEDGNILRVAASISSVFQSVLDLIPYMFLISLTVIGLSIIVTNLLTKNIIHPINNLNLEEPLVNDVYDEISPLLIRMEKQGQLINKQFLELKEKREEFKAITDNISEGLIVLNGNRQVLSINKSATEILGVSPEDSINKHILTLNRSLALQNAVNLAIEGKPTEEIFTSGNRTYNLLASPIRDKEPTGGIAVFILDITEKQSAEKMRREFSANVSHELKTPLTSIRGYAELLKNEMVKEKDITVLATRIYDEAMHLINLIDDIIIISKLDEKKLDSEFKKVNLIELTQEVIDRLDPLARKKGIRIIFRSDKAYVLGIKQVLKEMIYNLCENAIKYNREKGKVEIEIITTDHNVTLKVSDDGPGIPKEDHDRIFERFYRIDKSHSRNTGGTGLGLSIVKNSADFHNAQLELSSEPGKGTSFTVIFHRQMI